MEKEIKIKVDQKYSVYGRLSGSLNKSLLIIVHGLPCSIYDGLYESAAWWFEKNGYAVFRFNLYGWQEDARQLIDCTLNQHGSDLDKVVDYFHQKGAKKIFVAGHSFGAPSILSSQGQNFDAAVFWDGSYDISFVKKKYGHKGGRYIKVLNGYFMRWGPNVIIGKKMAEEVDNLNWDGLASQFRKPLSIMVASKGLLMDGAKRYFTAIQTKKSLVVIKGATHYFDDNAKVRDDLFKYTKKWLDRFK